MTSLDPSHIPGLSEKSRTGQAVHTTQPSAEADESGFPDDIDDLGSDAAEMKARRDGRDEIRRHVPALPDLRFEQVSSLMKRKSHGTDTPSPTSCRSDRSSHQPHPLRTLRREARSLKVRVRPSRLLPAPKMIPSFTGAGRWPSTGEW